MAIASDFHLGAKWRSRRQDDSFVQAKETIDCALKNEADFILILGDIFNDQIPRPEVWAKALRILLSARVKASGGLEILDTFGKDEEEISKVALSGVPVIAIHGNHERRSHDQVDSIQMLEAAGLLIKIDQNAILLDTPAGKVAIHGIGYVPEEHAGDVLEIWNPKPIKGAFNIFMIHQSLGQYVHSEDERPALTPATLPKGFDLYLSGHVHYHSETETNGSPLLFPGSTLRTQLLPIEAKVSKGFFMADLSESLSYNFKKLQSVRDFFYEEKVFRGANIHSIKSWIEDKIEGILRRPRKNSENLPIVRFRLRGSLAKESSQRDLDIEEMEEKFANKVLLYVSKEELASLGLREKTQFLRDLREKRAPIEDMVMKILLSNLEELNYDEMFNVRELYNLLSKNELDKASDRIAKVVNNLVESEMEGKN